ncbi:hypothetical protein [Bifidobacterium oedipodis]|nr:hypothetical protein [Bifidobacterium sp. DSM 109957]
MKLNDFWTERFQPSCAGLRECTQAGYESAWQCHIEPSLGEMDMDAITVE